MAIVILTVLMFAVLICINQIKQREYRERMRPAVDEAIANYRRVGSIIKPDSVDVE